MSCQHEIVTIVETHALVRVDENTLGQDDLAVTTQRCELCGELIPFPGKSETTDEEMRLAAFIAACSLVSCCTPAILDSMIAGFILGVDCFPEAPP